MTIYEGLIKEATYSLKGRSRSQVYQTYGKALMAWKLKAISKDEFYTLNDMLVRHGLNDPAHSKLDVI